MELKNYGILKRQLAVLSETAPVTPDSSSAKEKVASDSMSNDTDSTNGVVTTLNNNNKRTFLFEQVNGAREGSNLISSSLSSSNNSSGSRKRLKSSGTLSPLSLPRNTDTIITTNSCNNSVISSSNSSINTNSSGNGDVANQAMNNGVPFAANGWWKKGNEHIKELMSTSISSNGGLPNTNNSCDNSISSGSGNGMNSNSIKNISNQNKNGTNAVLSSGDQKSTHMLQLLGEVASSGGNNPRGMQQAQNQLRQQQELQAAMNNPFLGGPSPNRYPSSLNNNSIPRMAMQARLSSGLPMLDPSMFPSDGMSLSQLQLQQQHQFQLQQQSLYPFAFPNGNAPLNFTQNSLLQQRQNQVQRQQVQRPEAARTEVKIDTMRTSGDIGLEESYQQQGSFVENGRGGNNGKRKHNVELMDVNDLAFSDIVPMMPTSKVDGFDTDDDVGVDVETDVDGMFVGHNNMNNKLMHQRSSHSPLSNKQSKLNPYPRPTQRLKEVKFRAYQAENWTEKFEELLRFREENGHCLVPNCHPENPALAQWTKRQRYQYKLKMDGKRSTITDERVRALDEAGFVWDSHKAVWAERLEELKEFKKQYKHCNVPSRYKPNHQLAIWVKRQRRQWKNKIDRLPNCMTDERQRALEAIGFVWDMKKGKRSANSPNKQIIKK